MTAAFEETTTKSLADTQHAGDTPLVQLLFQGALEVYREKVEALSAMVAPRRKPEKDTVEYAMPAPDSAAEDDWFVSVKTRKTKKKGSPLETSTEHKVGKSKPEYPKEPEPVPAGLKVIVEEEPVLDVPAAQIKKDKKKKGKRIHDPRPDPGTECAPAPDPEPKPVPTGQEVVAEVEPVPVEEKEWMGDESDLWQFWRAKRSP
ncbi:hypothetical protein MFIFM68171_11318 [Madurella fahalii]|uniref:Uncharacterized protein n=1 Tax=Madurella fahalii TaxID=1157608 RepID=A0ABQ0GTP2_9PEZI